MLDKWVNYILCNAQSYFKMDLFRFLTQYSSIPVFQYSNRLIES
ncbi:hypothetical protein D1AOALGA4SA_10030 [Olavius algarvensis Delta 1 endosymbiont]|nr:hypothetical protein D1AOALGA4SA_10030 [Olavius algarvensis Delta 1 endosymbiont]